MTQLLLGPAKPGGAPVVTRFFWPPLMPRIMWLPTFVSAHTCAATWSGTQTLTPFLRCTFAILHDTCTVSIMAVH